MARRNGSVEAIPPAEPGDSRDSPTDVGSATPSNESEEREKEGRDVERAFDHAIVRTPPG